jgi:uncharacterized protein YjbI with pentapeptide repeats
LGPNLERASLDRANLSTDNLSRTHLSGAWLYKATLHGANLHRARLVCANLREAYYNAQTIWPKGLDWEAAGAVAGGVDNGARTSLRPQTHEAPMSNDL